MNVVVLDVVSAVVAAEIVGEVEGAALPDAERRRKSGFQLPNSVAW